MNQPWQYSTTHNSRCKVIEEETLWGQVVCHIWIPETNEVVQVPKDSLQPLSANLAVDNKQKQKSRIISSVAAGCVADAISNCGKKADDNNVLLAPLESPVNLRHSVNILKPQRNSLT